jgi:Mn-containing catalase
MLLNTGTEEIGHIEMLSTAVALNLEKAPLSFPGGSRRQPDRGRRAERHEPAPHPCRPLARRREGRQRRAFTRATTKASGNIEGDMLAERGREATGRAAGRRSAQHDGAIRHEGLCSASCSRATRCTSSSGWR